MTPLVSVVGLGRFGATLGALCDRARVEWEPIDALPGKATYHPRGELVLLAVPLDALESVLRALEPEPAQIVVDVCSVKVRATEILREVLGDRRWVATHPLFGPAALRIEERPRVIVCPRADRPADTSRVEALYSQLGCDVKLMDAEAHDRLMAQSQALGAFVGRGLRDAALPAEGPWTPPSTLPLYQLAASPTAQPGHLSNTLLFDNPCAAEVREKLIGALQALRPDVTSHDLEALRASIDAVDRRLVELLRQRAAIASEISLRKAEQDLPVHDPVRETAAFVDRRAWAAAAGIDPDFVEQLFQAVLPWSRALQEKVRG